MAVATIKFYPNRQKRKNDDGLTPVYLRIIYKGKKVEGKTTFCLTDNEVKKWNDDYINPNSTLFKRINGYRDRFFHFTSFNLEDIDNLSKIRDYVLNVSTGDDNPKVKEYISHFYTKIVLTSGQKKAGTKKNYNNAFRHFYNFLELNKLTGLHFKDVKKNTGRQFFDYLMSTIPEREKVAVTKESANGSIKKLSTVFDYAINDDLITFNPFKNLKISIESKYKTKLNILELKKIMKLDLTRTPSLEKYRKLFLFQCFSAVDYVDMINLKVPNLKEAPNENISLSYIRAKTNMPSLQYVNYKLQELINEFQKDPYCIKNNRLVPYTSLTQYNIHLKILSEKAELNIPLSTKHSRHSYRQLLKEARVVESSSYCSALGWSRKRHTAMDFIYSDVSHIELYEMKEKFELYLINHLTADGLE